MGRIFPKEQVLVQFKGAYALSPPADQNAPPPNMKSKMAIMGAAFRGEDLLRVISVIVGTRGYAKALYMPQFAPSV